MHRKKKNGNVWHWCSNCSNWPKDNYDTIFSKPDSGKMCEKCSDKSGQGKCNLGWRSD